MIHLKAVILIAGCLSFSAESNAATYKCQTEDGKIEYSSVPCGPGERPAAFSEDATFSTYDKSRPRRQEKPVKPYTTYDKKRQQAITDDARRKP